MSQFYNIVTDRLCVGVGKLCSFSRAFNLGFSVLDYLFDKVL